jgi:N-succinyldiaminopimelate aminotransferase
VQLVYVCSPGNPTGKVMDLAAWKTLFALSDRYGFVIASDECYSEIYFDEAAAAGRPLRPPRNSAAAITATW